MNFCSYFFQPFSLRVHRVIWHRIACNNCWLPAIAYAAQCAMWRMRKRLIRYESWQKQASSIISNWLKPIWKKKMAGLGILFSNCSIFYLFDISAPSRIVRTFCMSRVHSPSKTMHRWFERQSKARWMCCVQQTNVPMCAKLCSQVRLQQSTVNTIGNKRLLERILTVCF